MELRKNQMSINSFFSWQRVEIRILLLFFAVACLAFFFVKFASEILEGETHTFDSLILLALRNPAQPGQPVGPAWLTHAMLDITALGGTTVLALLTIFSLGFLIILRKRGTAFLVLISIAGGTLLNHLLKTGYERPRPDLVPHLVEVTSMSFPSGHAMLSTITYLTLGALLARAQERIAMRVYFISIAILLTLLIGLSRIYLGVHWPTDVLGGWCVGASWALLCWTFALWLQKRGNIDRNE